MSGSVRVVDSNDKSGPGPAPEKVKVIGHWIDDFFYIDPQSWSETAARLGQAYQRSEPFPHIVIENFIDPRVLDQVLEHFPTEPEGGSHTFERDQEKHKTQFDPDTLRNPYVSLVFNQLNSQGFLGGLEALTGIEGLVPDPYFAGGGFHETRPGGKLDVHTEFNFLERLRLERRVNLILFLNKDWQPGYGGELELWDVGMTKRYASVPPVFNTAVIFSTSLESFHGHPDPLNFPEGQSRKSIALYYYTSPLEALDDKPHRTTIFKPRPRSTDKVDYTIKRRHFVEDWCPPILLRTAKQLRRTFRR